MPPLRRHHLGRVGETLAFALLLVKGYRPRHRNWRGGGGELDLVMSQRGETVFVEVKSRSSSDFGGAAAALDEKKKRRLTRASSAYLSRYSLWQQPCRFDLVTIERSDGLVGWRIRHYRNVFRPDRGRQF